MVTQKHGRDRPGGWFSLYVQAGGMSIVAAVFLLFLTWLSMAQLQLGAQFEQNGVVTQAQISEQRVWVSRDSDGDTWTYYMTFVYDGDGAGG